MARRLLPALTFLALLATTAAHAETAPAPAPPAAVAAPAASATPLGTRVIAIAVGAAAGALMPQVTVVDGLVLMSAIMGGMIADMAYNSAHGAMQK